MSISFLFSFAFHFSWSTKKFLSWYSLINSVWARKRPTGFKPRNYAFVWPFSARWSFLSCSHCLTHQPAQRPTGPLISRSELRSGSGSARAASATGQACGIAEPVQKSGFAVDRAGFTLALLLAGWVTLLHYSTYLSLSFFRKLRFGARTEDMLLSVGSQRVGHDLATEQQSRDRRRGWRRERLEMEAFWKETNDGM